MKRLQIIYALLALVCSALSAHAQNPSPFSSQRFALHLSSTYHRNPWENYNTALAT